MPPNVSRGLLCISKILQNMSNGVMFGTKEPEMSHFNEVIKRNFDKFSEFLDRATKVSKLILFFWNTREALVNVLQLFLFEFFQVSLFFLFS